MSTPLGSEPAFARQALHVTYPNGESEWIPSQDGMSTRTWLVGTIAAGMWANEHFVQVAAKKGQVYEVVSASAVEAADALLAALQTPESPTHTEATPEPPNAR